MAPYQPLFTLNLGHQFFNHDNEFVMDILPNGHTEKLVSSSGIVLRTTANSVSLLVNEEGLDILTMEQQSPGEEKLSLVFKIYPGEASFYQYSQLENFDNDKLFYFTNELKHHNSANNGCYLHHGDYVGDNEIILPSQLATNSQLDKRDKIKKPLAVAEIVLSRELGFDFTDWSAPMNYRIQFAAPSNQWKYCIFGADESSQLWVEDPNNEYAFDYLGYRYLERASHSKPAHIFLSQQDIPLKRKQDLRFQLKRSSEFGSQVLLDTLPVAGYQNIVASADQGTGKLHSEIYINL